MSGEGILVEDQALAEIVRRLAEAYLSLRLAPWMTPRTSTLWPSIW